MAMRFILYFEFLIFNIKIIQNKIINILPFLKIKLNTNFTNGDWGLGIGDWGLGIGDWAQSPIPKPPSPIPNPHFPF